jgi:hypothetical protein
MGDLLSEEMGAIIEKVKQLCKSGHLLWAQQVAKCKALGRLYLLQLDKQKDCQKTILCECMRRNCPYRPLAVSTYIRKLRSA